MPVLRCHVILNLHSGTALAQGITAAALVELFEAHDMIATVDDDDRRPLADRIAAAMRSPHEVVVAAGGDGTITALAEAIIGSHKTLAILPLGTVNALAKDLAVPLGIDAAVAALAHSSVQKIDVGEVNGRIFLHKVVVGLIPALAKAREHIRGRSELSTKLGFLRYFLRRIARTRRIAVTIKPLDGPPRAERVQAIAVASNSYDEGFGRFFARERLDRGELTLYVLKHFTFADFLRLTSGMLLGHWTDDEALRIESVSGVTIGSHKGSLKVMLDGEVETLVPPLDFRIRPGALSVLTPDPIEDKPTPEIAGTAQP